MYMYIYMYAKMGFTWTNKKTRQVEGATDFLAQKGHVCEA